MDVITQIGIITNRDKHVGPVLATLVDFLASRAAEVVLDIAVGDDIAQDLSLPRAGIEDMANRVDLIMVIGGDGTMLRAARLLAGCPVRMLGINLGHLGFLTDISPHTMTEQLGRILDGEFIEEPRFLLHASIMRDGKIVETSHALNEIVVSKWNVARLISFETIIDGTFVHRQRSDGMIIATPTGSTAYALSGGGPILHPSLDTIVLVPICPHTLSQRPIVVDGNSRIEIVLDPEHHHNARLSTDGEFLQELQPGDHIVIEKLADPITLLHPADHDTYATLRAKLGWGREV